MTSHTPPSDPGETSSADSHHRLLKIAAWLVGGVTVLLLFVVVTATILLNSARFHAYLLGTLQKQASESLGVPVTLQNFTLNLSTLSLDLYGLTVAGANPYPNPPVLQVQHAEVGVRIVSLLQRKWYVESIEVNQPVVQVFVDKNGVSNLPAPKSNGSKSNTSIFDLGIRHAVLNRGDIFYNDRHIPLAADLHNLDLHAAFDEIQKKYSGRLAYADGQLVFGTYRPFQHDFDAQFDATPAAFHLTPAKVSSGASQIVLTATVTNYTNPSVQATYDVTVDGAQAAKILNNPSIPAGLVRATGTAQYQQVSNRALLDTLIVSGDVNSRQLTVMTASANAAISHVAAHYSLANGDLLLHDLKANLLGGELTAQGTMKNISGDSRTKLDAALHGISLAESRRTLGASKTAPGVALTGVLNAGATMSWGKTMDDLVARADARIDAHVSGSNTNAAGTAPSVIPVNSALHATYTASNQQLALTESYLRTPQTNLAMNGVVSNRSSLAVQLEANDLSEVAILANLVRAPTPGQPLQPIDLAGAASFRGNVQGTTAAPHLSGQLSATNLHVNGIAWKVFRTNLEVSPSMISLQHADLEPEKQGRITFNASAELTKWAFTNTSAIQADLDASQMDIADLEKLAGQQIPVSGVLNTHVTVHGTQMNPIGSGDLTLTKVMAYEEPVTAVKVHFSGTGDEAHADLSVQLPAGDVQGKISVRPKDKSYIAQVTSDGIQIDKLQALKSKNVDATGTVSLNANGRGTFDNPQLDATVQIPTLLIQKQTVSAINLQVNVANHVANATLASKAVNTSIQAKARVELTGDYLADASLDTQNIPIQPLLAVYAPEQANSVTGDTELHATLHGPLKNKNLIEAHVTIPVLKLAYGNNIQLAATAPLHADYKNGIVEVQRGAIRGTDTDLQFQGSIPTTSGNAPMSLMLQGTVNLQLAQLFDPDVRTSGEIKLNINSNGTSNGAEFGGEIEIVDANYASGDLPVGLEHGNGVLTLTSNRINIKSFQGTVGNGTVTAQGGIVYRPAIQFDLGLAAKGVRMLYPQGVREGIDANLRLAGTTENADLGGTINLSNLSFTPGFDLSNFISQLSGGVEAPPSQGLSQNVQLNLSVRSTNNVNLVSRTLSVNGAANLQVRGTAANPVILGRVDLNGGDIILNGNRFVLAGGTVQFVNPSETQPVVNLTLNTSIQQYNISMRFNGPIDQLRTQYSSDPSLPSADIINLLAFGKTTEAGAGDTAAPANQVAESVIASQVSSQVTSRVSKIAGISQLSINPVLAGSSSQGPPGANITIQQRVTGNLFITFSTNVASTQSQTIQGQYQVSPRVAVSATRDPNGGFAMDALIKKTW